MCALVPRTSRRGRYLKDDVKMNAINDGLLLEAHIYVLLQRYFSEDTNYVKVRPAPAARPSCESRASLA